MSIKGMKVKTVSVRKRGAAHMWAEIYPDNNFSVLCELGTQEKRLYVPTTEMEDLRKVADNFRHFEEYYSKLKEAGVKTMPDFKCELSPVPVTNGNGHAKAIPEPVKIKVKKASSSEPAKSRRPVRV